MSFYIQLEQPLSPHTVSQLINAIDMVNIGFNQSQGVAAAACRTLTGNVCATLAPATQFGDSTGSGSFAPSAAPPTVVKAFGAATIPLNGSTSPTFTITNPNASSQVSGVFLNDSLPAGLVVSTPNGLTDSCGGAVATAGSGTISLVDIALAADASCTFSVNVTGTTLGTKNNTTAKITWDQGAGGTASASVTVIAVASPPTTVIPTLQQWALWLLGVVLIIAASAQLRRRKGGYASASMLPPADTLPNAAAVITTLNPIRRHLRSELSLQRARGWSAASYGGGCDTSPARAGHRWLVG